MATTYVNCQCGFPRKREWLANPCAVCGAMTKEPQPEEPKVRRSRKPDNSEANAKLKALMR